MDSIERDYIICPEEQEAVVAYLQRRYPYPDRLVDYFIYDGIIIIVFIGGEGMYWIFEREFGQRGLN